MEIKPVFRKTKQSDLADIISLLAQDSLGAMREDYRADNINERYKAAFQHIDADPNQYLTVAESNRGIIGTCHITIMPSLTFMGTTRVQIEAVRIHPDFRGQKIGEMMIQEAIRYGQSKGAEIIQLTTNKERPEAIRFYERLGFKSTHEGMKLYLTHRTELDFDQKSHVDDTLKIGRADQSDISAMNNLSNQKRLSYEIVQRKFWRWASEAGEESQREWFKKLI